MRISELSTHSGLPVASIKFYLREGLLAAGDLTSPNQASYSQEHVDRLRLVRALLEVGGLSVASARDVLAAIDSTSMPLQWVFGIAQHAIAGGLVAPATTGPDAPGATLVAEQIAARGWRIQPDNPGIAMAASVLDAYESMGYGSLNDTIGEYARAAEIVAEADLDAVAGAADRAGMAEVVVVGTVLGDTLFAGVRRMAQEHVSGRRYEGVPSEGIAPEIAVSPVPDAGASAAC